MIIFGAKGFAKEVLEVCLEKEDRDNIVFYDDVSTDLPDKLYNEFKIMRTLKEVEEYFREVDNRFVLGLGGPALREMAWKKFTSIGGQPSSMISSTSRIGSFGVELGEGVNVMLNSVITNDVRVGKGVLINQISSIGHDVDIEDFVEVCPGVVISGRTKIGEFTFLGSNCTILPNISVGSNVIVGAGSVINRDIPNGCTVVGVPGKIIKTN
ncbi:NeuD/PglB/VioB family sugar acetyltransferase [Sphingobacterium sp. 1.A.5]|uniref:NeuD/PglB/VioB family sugar acetyltransferase n=1 Tax=Sphingobacterium sp. 1.A.5 TaxID=2044604 RepID=UPI000C0BE63B|nr:NeuD/PglB/VioB family sugar acetyltransferase [Sphingobacterium sp. 1.A.5]